MGLRHLWSTLAVTLMAYSAGASDSPAHTLKCADVLSPSQCLVPGKGRTVVRVCVSARGKVRSVTVTDTSGYKELDSASLSLMKRGRFKAATRDGKPISSCKDYAVVFE